MAARQGNSTRSVKTSMVEELLTLVSTEEYLDTVPKFSGTDYLNRVELASLKKMISGKLWVDSRKFLNRQNLSIPSGMLSMFGQTVGKSAIDVKGEICDQLIDTDNKRLREILRNSMKSTKQSYSSWITNLNQDNATCNELVIYLLCRTYKRHVVVILSSKLSSLFKPGNMSTFEQLNKADHVLVWMGEDKYGEIKPLHIKTGIGNVLEWQHLAETVQHLHEKRLSSKQQKRPEKPTSINTPAPQKQPQNDKMVQKRGKHESSLNIDYKHYHSDGIRSAKSPRNDKPLPRASGPSTTRMAAQQMINDQKTNANKTVCTTDITSIKREQSPRANRHALVKPEPGIFMVYKKPKDNVYWHYAHTDGKPCPSGAHGVCKRKRSRHKPEDDMYLPDLPASPPATRSVVTRSITECLDNIDVNTKAAIKTVLSGYVRQPRSVSTTQPEITNTDNTSKVITLVSPPAVNRTTEIPSTPKHKNTNNLNDLLCTLNFEGGSDAPTEKLRSVVTQANDPSHVPATSILSKTDQEMSSETPRSADIHPSNIGVTDITGNSSTPNSDIDALKPRSGITVQSSVETETLTDTREILTPKTNALVTTRTESTQPVSIATDTEVGGPEFSTPKPISSQDNTARSVVTDATVEGISPNTPSSPLQSTLTVVQDSLPLDVTDRLTGNIESMGNYDSDDLPDLVLPQTRSVTTAPGSLQTGEVTHTPARTSSDNCSHPSVTARSILSDPDESEIETANMLLSLGSLENIDQAVDNETLLPVNKPQTEDFTKDLANQEQTRRDIANEDTDSDKTVEYGASEPGSPDRQRDPEEIPSPKGVMRYKHYGIKRHSPTASKNRRMRCPTCDAICYSKKQLNKHHRTEHANVSCPDCDRVFPTPDALTHHWYSHKEDHQYSCDICGKLCPFQSDLMRHKEKHNENRKWTCDEPDCGREFKCKAELVAHMVVHKGELFICEYPGCQFSSNDPRNVKRHYRVHTKEGKM